LAVALKGAATTSAPNRSLPSRLRRSTKPQWRPPERPMTARYTRPSRPTVRWAASALNRGCSWETTCSRSAAGPRPARASVRTPGSRARVTGRMAYHPCGSLVPEGEVDRDDPGLAEQEGLHHVGQGLAPCQRHAAMGWAGMTDVGRGEPELPAHLGDLGIRAVLFQVEAEAVRRV